MSTVVHMRGDLRAYLDPIHRAGRTIGLVPTMGALHEGHASLIRAARAENHVVVVTIFVNPTQFGPREDLKSYPRPFERDVALCAQENVDSIFAPSDSEMYPHGFRTYIEVHGLQDVLCGASRPGHFRGVCTVVAKLFNLIRPTRAYFGQKDAQQVRILQQMVRDLDIPVEMRVCPIVREPDGLALSSRNQYLDADARGRAVALSQALAETARKMEAGERDSLVLQHALANRLAAVPGAQLDYAAVVDADTLLPPPRLKGKTLLAVAVKFGTTRLIDNLLVDA